MSLLVGCGQDKEDVQQTMNNEEVQQEQASEDSQIVIETTKEPEILEFVDAFGAPYQVEINPDVDMSPYQKESFVLDGNKMSYVGENYLYRLGVDVSHYQGDIDWDAVKNAGYEFAIIRIGFRGYGEAGVMKADSKFEENIQGAQAAGLDVGVYFFAQAINEAEAIEEAEFVLQNLQGYELQMPVVYDPESILHDESRTDDVTGEQFTKNTKVFCETIKKAGYDPMVYCNMLWQAYELDLEELSDYPIWYADYEPTPQTPYHFDIWQYTDEGTVDGIQGNVDLNIQMKKK